MGVKNPPMQLKCRLHRMQPLPIRSSGAFFMFGDGKLSQSNWANAELLNGCGLLDVSFEDWQKTECAKSEMWQVSLLFRESLFFRWIFFMIGL